MKPWNPDNLTPAQVGNGWRLLDEDEVECDMQYDFTSFWEDGRWDDVYWKGHSVGGVAGRRSSGYECSLRTQLTREEFKSVAKRRR